MFDKDGTDHFGSAVDNLLMEVDLENRGCQLVSPTRSISSDNDQLSVLSKLRTLLEGQSSSPKTPGVISKSPRHEGSREFVTPELSGTLSHRLYSRDLDRNSPAASQMSDSSVKSSALKKSERNNVLRHAEAVIEYQRDRINALEAAVAKFNTALTQTTDMYKQELQRQVDDNLNLRQEMQKVVTEFEVLSKRYEMDMAESESLKKQVNFLSHDLSKRELELSEAQEKLTQLPIDNSDLREKNRVLSNEIDRLNREISGLSLLDSKINTRNSSGEVAATTQSCAAQHERLKASSKCIAQLENDLQSYKRLTESQSMDIKRLNHQLEKLRGSSKPNDYMVLAQKQMLQIRSIFMQLAKQAKEPKPISRQPSMEESIENRSLYAAYGMRSSTELREMYEKIMDMMNRSSFGKSRCTDCFSLSVVYSCNDMENEMQVDIDESMLTLRRDDQDSSSTEVIKIPLRSVVGVKKADDLNEFCIHTNDMSIHVLRAPNRDIFNRLHYALQYAGFVTEHTRFSIFSQADLSWVPPDFSWPNDIAAVSVTESSLSADCPSDLEGVRRYISDVHVITDPMERLCLLDHSTGSIIMLGPQLSSVPLVMPSMSTFAMRVCDATHKDCNFVEHVVAPTATLFNGGPTNFYFVPAQHIFAFIPDNRRVIFVKGIDSSNEKRLLRIVQNTKYREFSVAATAPEHHDSMASSIGAPQAEVAPEGDAGPSELMPAASQDRTRSKGYEFVDTKLVLYNGQDDEIIIDNKLGYYRVNKETNDVSLSSGSEEFCLLNFSTVEALQNFINELESRGFKQQEKEEVHFEVCVVSKDRIQLFVDTTKPPIVTYLRQDTTVTIQEDKRFIILEHTKDKSIRMELDCTKPKEFRNWKFALGFAGFIKGPAKPKNADMMKQYIFAVKLQKNDSKERRSFQVLPDSILLYANPTQANPLLTMKRSEIHVELTEVHRRLRVYVNRNCKTEERFDFIITMMSDYELVKQGLHKHGYIKDVSKEKNKVIQLPFVYAKAGLIAVFRSKFDKEPQLELERLNYTAEVSNMCIKFISKMDIKKVIKIDFKKEFNFKRWIMALKVAGYLPLTSEVVPVLYMPTIMYGHVCPEIPMLLKGHLK
ncbi:hypothetical protein BBOV_III001860 [Babesia bovis T2Bo]|uniref:Uncharacterized protein n=1 Tax=Babesia bovis TaxID=5865 RepID=A7AMG9_BABBO|nr:hypothetical protein BBOV_III001860 [Babesia bovis T2Bo]EDO07753.1 hypothetical protein BBOV_III001860 [Babesia bovis T2Bo]|eukprot:XP_001611321.1 hypothetical protein [Babesia bovis T2Bo]